MSLGEDIVVKVLVGIGLFKIKLYIDGFEVVVERYDDYWGGKVFIN